MPSFKTTKSAFRNGLRNILLLVFLYLLIMKLSTYRNIAFNNIKEQSSDNGSTFINGFYQNQIGEKVLTKTISVADVNDFNSSLKKQNYSEQKAIQIQREDSFDYKAAMNRLNEEKVAADDPRLVDLIRNYYILPPSTLEYKLAKPEWKDPSVGQTAYVDRQLNHTKGGFFVECGGLDGELRSNTLFLERYRGWSGLLIEADPQNFDSLVRKHRKAYAINACLNIHPYPSVLTFQQDFNLGKIVEERPSRRSIKVQCFPLYSILLALNQLTVDFFSLDVEGFELKVLKTVPFDKINIKMMTVEYAHQDTGIEALQNFVEEQGYKTLLNMTKAHDLIFRKKVTTN